MKETRQGWQELKDKFWGLIDSTFPDRPKTVREHLENLSPIKETLPEEEFFRHIGELLAERVHDELVLFGDIDTEMFRSEPFQSFMAHRRRIEDGDTAYTRIFIPGFIPEGTFEDLHNISAIQTPEDPEMTQGYLIIRDLFVIWDSAERTAHPTEKHQGVIWRWGAISEQLVSQVQKDFERQWRKFSRKKN